MARRKKAQNDLLYKIIGIILIIIAAYIIIPALINLIKVLIAIIILLVGIFLVTNKPKRYIFWN